MDNAERLCDAVCIIAQGEKVLDGTIATVKAEHGGRYIALALGEDRTAAGDVAAVLGDRTLVQRVDDSNRTVELELAPHANAQLLLRRLMDAGAVVERFELVQPSLHRIFLDKVGAAAVEPGMGGDG
jgi:ABC-2 type transport system ATP-binding protein